MNRKNLKHIHILVVDDEEDIREILQRIINAAGYDCSVAGNAVDALKVLEEKNVDVVMTDIVMPGLDGIELTGIVKKKYDADVIVMTGFVEDYKYEEIVDKGASDLIQKPINNKEVLVRLKRVVKERAVLAERKQAEVSLKESEKSLKEALEIAHLGQWKLDLISDTLHWSDGIYRIFEIDPDKSGASFEAFLDSVHPEDRDSVNKAYIDSLKNKTPYNIVHRLLFKDGTIKYVNEICRTEYDQEGNPLYSFGTVQDITELKQAEKKIEEYSKNLEHMVEERTRELNRALYDTEASRDRIDGILKSVSDGLIVTDIYNRILLMNSTAEDLLGVRFSEVIDRLIDFAIDESSLREKLINILGKKETGYHFDFELPGDDPKYPRFMRAGTSVIHDREGKDTGIVTIFHDVTHEREVDRMKTEFLSTAAHELRTPLTSIQGFSEILQTREDLNEEEKKRFLSYINKQAVNLAEIVNDLLDISRIESGKGYAINKEICDTGKALKNIIPYFQETSSKHKFEVVLPDKPVKCYVDKDKMEQVLKNLLSNAVKYSPEGGVIRVVGEVIEDYYQVSVEDQGMGMTPEQVEKIFDKFYRADASNTAISGTGLGMSIVKYIVEAHGGKVFVESELEKGTTVRVTIPMKNKKNEKESKNT